MRKEITTEVDTCDFCPSETDCYSRCMHCGKDVCYDCKKTAGHDYTAGVSFQGHGDGFYCNNCLLLPEVANTPLLTSASRPGRPRPRTRLRSCLRPTVQVINASSPEHAAQIGALGEFVGADSIEYEDRGNGENYLITKGGKQLLIKARGNKFDGGFLSIEVVP